MNWRKAINHGVHGGHSATPGFNAGLFVLLTDEPDEGLETLGFRRGRRA